MDSVIREQLYSNHGRHKELVTSIYFVKFKVIFAKLLGFEPQAGRHVQEIFSLVPVADPGFPVGVRGPIRGGCGSPMRALFGENVCKNERIGSQRGVCARYTP